MFALQCLGGNGLGHTTQLCSIPSRWNLTKSAPLTGCTRSVNDTPPKADTRRLDTFVHAIQEVSTCPPAAQDRTVTGCNSHHAQGAQGSAQRPPWPASGQHRPYGCLAGPLAGRSPRAARSASTRAFARWRPVVHRAEANPPDRCHLRADSEW